VEIAKPGFRTFVEQHHAGVKQIFEVSATIEIRYEKPDFLLPVLTRTSGNQTGHRAKRVARRRECER
jgi:hypothetical protein